MSWHTPGFAEMDLVQHVGGTRADTPMVAWSLDATIGISVTFLMRWQDLAFLA